jgi:hypothetical protein
MSSLPKLDLTGVKGRNPVEAFLTPVPDPAALPDPVPAPEAAAAAPRAVAAASAARTTSRPRTQTRRPKPPASAEAAARTSRTAFYGSGELEQRSIAIEPELYTNLTDLSRAARVPSNTLFLAAVHAKLPTTSREAVKAIVGERAEHPGRRREYTPRIPIALRVRLDELIEASRETLPKANRADLVNAALRAGLPADAHRAAELVTSWERERELAQLPIDSLG